MSAALILAQSTVPNIGMGPGTLRRWHIVRLKFTVGSSGAVNPSIAASTDPGLSAGAFASSVFPITFPKCRAAEVLSCRCVPLASKTTAASWRQPQCDEPNALAGTVNLYPVAAAAGSIAVPLDGDIVTLMLALDFG